MHLDSLFPEAVDELPNEPNLHPQYIPLPPERGGGRSRYYIHAMLHRYSMKRMLKYIISAPKHKDMSIKYVFSAHMKLKNPLTFLIYRGKEFHIYTYEDH